MFSNVGGGTFLLILAAMVVPWAMSVGKTSPADPQNDQPVERWERFAWRASTRDRGGLLQSRNFAPRSKSAFASHSERLTSFFIPATFAAKGQGKIRWQRWWTRRQ
jgi:hypothetical protein